MCKCRISATFGRIKRHGEPRLELKSDKMKTVIKYLILLPFIMKKKMAQNFILIMNNKRK